MPRRLGLTSLIALLLPTLFDEAVAQQDAKDIVASQLRAQGYACDQPQSATRDGEASKPNAAVWVVVCENATYRATLVPNMAATVEKLPKDEAE